jgi:hypothetical protein
MLVKIITGFICFLILVFLIEIIRKKWFGKKTGDVKITIGSGNSEADEFCCGKHEVCEKNKLLKALSKNIEYYDDEELDIYRGRASDGYTDTAVEEFREIFYTMQKKEVSGWIKSLKIREIEIPDQIKDEIISVINE